MSVTPVTTSDVSEAAARIAAAAPELSAEQRKRLTAVLEEVAPAVTQGVAEGVAA